MFYNISMSTEVRKLSAVDAVVSLTVIFVPRSGIPDSNSASEGVEEDVVALRKNDANERPFLFTNLDAFKRDFINRWVNEPFISISPKFGHPHEALVAIEILLNTFSLSNSAELEMVMLG